MKNCTQGRTRNRLREVRAEWLLPEPSPVLTEPQVPGVFPPPGFGYANPPSPCGTTMVAWFSLEPALGRSSGHHIRHDHGSTGPVPASGYGDAKATAGVLRDRGQEELYF
jgi:hypothetical protein